MSKAQLFRNLAVSVPIGFIMFVAFERPLEHGVLVGLLCFFVILSKDLWLGRR